MDIDTRYCESYARQVHALRRQVFFSDFSLSQRHQSILAKIESIRQYFLTIARQAEGNESMIPIQTISSSIGTPHFSSNYNLRPMAQILKKDEPMTGEVSYSYSALDMNSLYKSKWFESKNQASVGNFKAVGECSLKLWDNKKFDPSIELGTQVSASLLDLSSRNKLGNDKVNATLHLNASVGKASAGASVVVNKDEQTFEFKGLAAALEGEAKLAFNLFGMSVTITGSGSLLSAGADVSYSHKNREWEVGSKLGFIAGLGLKVNVKY